MSVAGGEPQLTVAILESRDGKVAREIVYITQGFKASPERAAWAERFEVSTRRRGSYIGWWRALPDNDGAAAGDCRSCARSAAADSALKTPRVRVLCAWWLRIEAGDGECDCYW